VIENYFNITYVRNPGAAFGFLAQSHPEFREPFFLVLPPIAMLIILWVLKSVQTSDRLQVVALSLVFGGAIGNYIDRLRFGYVIDFLDFHIQNRYTWPAFNVADSAIVVGIGILLILSFVRSEESVSETSSKRKAK
jgi:signal peptidase II